MYPDSDKVGVWVGNDDDSGDVPPRRPVDYFDGETC